MKKPYDYLIYVPGEAFGVKIVCGVNPDGSTYDVNSTKVKKLLKYLLKDE